MRTLLELLKDLTTELLFNEIRIELLWLLRTLLEELTELKQGLYPPKKV